MCDNITLQHTVRVSAGRHHVLPSGSLQVESVQSSDEGVYRCIAVNPVSNERLPADNTVILRTLPRQSVILLTIVVAVVSK